MEKIVIATDKFKGNLTSSEVADAIRNGILKGCLDLGLNIQEVKQSISILPLADGGDGSLCAVSNIFTDGGTPFRTTFIESVNHLGAPVQVPVLLYNNDTAAFVEMASVCGLQMIPKKQRALGRSTTYGLGVVINSLIEEQGIRDITIAIGGSGTNDGGYGMLAALGYSFTTGKSATIPDVASFLKGITAISDKYLPGVTPHLKETKIKTVCDVKNPLTGEYGASLMFARQKLGPQESPLLIEELEDGMKNWAKVVTDFVNDNSLTAAAGSGAAGGVGFAFLSLLNAQMIPGWKYFAWLSGLEEKIKESEIVFTGEGKFDRQSLLGKLPSGVLDLSRKYGKKCILVTGKIEMDKEDLNRCGFEEIIEVNSKATCTNDAFTKTREIIVKYISNYISRYYKLTMK